MCPIVSQSLQIVILRLQRVNYSLYKNNKSTSRFCSAQSHVRHKVLSCRLGTVLMNMVWHTFLSLLPPLMKVNQGNRTMKPANKNKLQDNHDPIFHLVTDPNKSHFQRRWLS